MIGQGATSGNASGDGVVGGITRGVGLDRTKRGIVLAADIATGFWGVNFAFLIYASYAGGYPTGRLYAAIVCIPVMAWFAPRIHRAAFRGDPAPVRAIVLCGVAATAIALHTPSAGGDSATILWLGVAVLHLPRIGAIVAVAGVIAFNTSWIAVQASIFAGSPMPTTSILGLLIVEVQWSLMFAAIMYLLAWLWRSMQEVNEGHEAKAKLAVSEERLRISRDLHDLLGHSLSVIALKSELAAKLSPPEAERSVAEMADVRVLARQSLREMRTVVRGYRSLDLDDELAGVRSVLEAAGVECTVSVDASGVSGETRSLLAWAVREGATNILKHSKATKSDITLDHGVLEIRNNGVESAQVAGDGSGIAGLTERIADTGGTLTARQEGNSFTLRVVVPAQDTQVEVSP